MSKRPITEDEQKFLQWYQMSLDYGFHSDITEEDVKLFNEIINSTEDPS